VNESHVLDIGIDQFWNMTFEKDGSLPINTFYEMTEDFSNVKITDWDASGQKIMDLDTKITGIPYIDKTRTQIKIQKKIKNDSMFVVELTSETFDLPQSSYFLIHEAWVVMQSPFNEHQTVFQRLMWFEFTSWTIM
jgi:hypothetical protein